MKQTCTNMELQTGCEGGDSPSKAASERLFCRHISPSDLGSPAPSGLLWGVRGRVWTLEDAPGRTTGQKEGQGQHRSRLAFVPIP